MTGPKKSPFTTEGFKKTHRSLIAAGQDIVKLINTVDTNHKDKLLEEELEKLREAMYQINLAVSLIAHANQIHHMRMIK
jgi:hypothetical protein